MALLMLMKAQPLAYNKENQEDKEPVFDTLDTVLACLRAFRRHAAGVTGKARRTMAQAARRIDRHRPRRLFGTQGRRPHDAPPWARPCVKP